jgi:dienelactone hydrolase
MPRRVASIFLACSCWGAAACAEEISVPVDYQGHEIQLTGRFEKPPGPGPLPVVILLHNCAGIDGSPSLAVWAQLMWAQGYATLRLDSFTARGYSNVCANTSQVKPSERAQDVLAAAYLLAVRPDVRPDRIAMLGLSHGAGTAIYVARDHEELRSGRERLAARRGKLVASVALYGGCGPSPGYPVIIPLLALLGGNDDWTPAASCVALANTQANGIMQAMVYPDAYHSFDAAGGIEKPHSAYGHMLAYNPAATADAHQRAVEFLYRYLH